MLYGATVTKRKLSLNYICVLIAFCMLSRFDNLAKKEISQIVAIFSDIILLAILIKE